MIYIPHHQLHQPALQKKGLNFSNFLKWKEWVPEPFTASLWTLCSILMLNEMHSVNAAKLVQHQDELVFHL